MRDPSIHIKESDLIELLKDYIPKGKVLEITKKLRSMLASKGQWLLQIKTKEGSKYIIIFG